MSKKYVTALILLCIPCIILTFAVCNHHQKYQPFSYTKEEVLTLYREKVILFDAIVEIISSNETFYNKGRINEYTDADIISPYDNALVYFSDAERNTINELFELKPYMILYDYARRFVQITFISADNKSSYTFLFWTFNGDNSQLKLNNYLEYLTQNYIVEHLQNNHFMIYRQDSGTYSIS